MLRDDFILDQVENPHPDLLKEALKRRRDADDSTWGLAFWEGYLLAMCKATGESAEAIEAWMDRSIGRPKMGHGTRACYMRGCREQECCEANREYMREYRYSTGLRKRPVTINW